MNINYWGVVQSVQHALPLLKESRGGILVVSSMAGKVGTSGRTGYCPTKFAVNGFCESLRFEIAPLGVKLTCACPGTAIPSGLRGRAAACDSGVRAGYVVTEIHERYLKASGRKRNLSKFITADVAAQEMLTGYVNGDRELIMNKAGILLPLRAVMPYWLNDAIVERSNHSAFADGDGEGEQKKAQ